MITVSHLAMTIADAAFSIFSLSPSGACRDAHVTDFIILLAVPKHLLSEPKVQRDLNLNGTEGDSRETGGHTINIRSTFKLRK